MPFVDMNGLKVIERLPGWKGRYFHSASMTFAHYEFAAGSSIHEHFHPEEEVYEVLEGELEVTIDGKMSDCEARRRCHCAREQPSFRQSTDGRAPDCCRPPGPPGFRVVQPLRQSVA